MCELAEKKNVQRQLLPCTWNKDKTNVWTLTARIYKISLNFSKSFSLWGLTWLSLHVFIPGRPWFNIHYGFFFVFETPLESTICMLMMWRVAWFNFFSIILCASAVPVDQIHTTLAFILPTSRKTQQQQQQSDSTSMFEMMIICINIE